MAGPDFAVALADLDKALSSIEAVVDPDRAEIADLEQQVAAPDLWDNLRQCAAGDIATVGVTDRSRSSVAGGAQLDDLSVLVQLGQEEEIKPASPRQQTCSPRCTVEILEVRTLLSGDYDEREAPRHHPFLKLVVSTQQPTSPQCCCRCTCAGPNAIAFQPRYMTPPTRRRRASSPPHSR